MRLRPPSTLTAALAASAGLLLALPAATAVADPLPAPGTGPFVATVAGEDGCSMLFAGGQIVWPEAGAEPATVDVSGWKQISGTSQPGDPCLPVVVADRQVEFTAYSDGEAVAEHIEPFNVAEAVTPVPFAFALAADAEIEAVTVAICHERRADGSTWDGRCGGVETVTPAEDTGQNPYPHCRYAHTLQQWQGGFLSEIEVIPVEADATEWRIELTLAEGTVVTALWNGEWEQDGTRLVIANAAWNGTVQVGDSVKAGFVGLGEPPTAVSVFVDGEQCWDVDIEV